MPSLRIPVPGTRAGRVVAGVTTATALVGAVSWLAASRLPPGAGAAPVRLSWPVLTALVAVAQSCVLNVQIKREARSVALTEIPLLLGLLYAGPVELLVGRLVGGVLAQLIARRQYRHPSKLAFNTVLVTAEATMALLLFRLLAGELPVTSPVTWLAAGIATAVASTATGVIVATLIQLLEDERDLRDIGNLVLTALPQAAAVSTVAVVVAAAVLAGPWTAVPLAVTAVLVLAAYRAYASLREQHLGLERLYRFSQVVTSSPETSRVLTLLLEQVCDLLHADMALVRFFPGSAGGLGDGVEAVLRRGRPLDRQPVFYLAADAAWIVDAVSRDESSVLIPRGSRDVTARHWLQRCGLTDAIVVPVRGDAGIVAAICAADRMGDARGFDRDDVRLLETVANHAAVALRNGQLVDQLRHDSLHDALTGMPNRTYFQRELDRALTTLVEGGGGFAVAVLDLDSFKDVNDTLGHNVGDDLLCEVASRLRSAAGDRATVARLGGDEFAVLVPACSDPDAGERFCRGLLASFGQPVAFEGTEIDVAASVGVAVAPLHGTSREQLLKRADMAMYAAKQDGRDVAVFDPALDTTSPSRLALVAALRRAIVEDRLEVHVQPKASLRTGDLVSVEALVRWTDPERGPIVPEEFVPLAERSGLVRPLTDLVLRQAIAACAGWQGVAPGVGVAVNISARSLSDDGILHLVDRLLRRHELPPGLLTLELTESSVMADPAGTFDLLMRLRRRGVRLSIDDFGTGYSSLSYLRRLPVNEVKIDRSFVQGMATEPEDAAIVRSILELARTLDLSVVAEGVETVEVWRQLAEMGCDVAQGWCLSPPMPVADFPVWCRSRPATPAWPAGLRAV
ncbi:MAG: putative bifunctional diguanylate cyclase/phosphodiesterase [Frankiaceae bacterium]